MFLQCSLWRRRSLCARYFDAGVHGFSSTYHAPSPAAFQHKTVLRNTPHQLFHSSLYAFYSGAVGTTSWMDRFLGRASAYLRLSFIDGVNDHSSSEYVRLFKQLVVNSKTSLFEKAKSVVKDAAQKVTFVVVRLAYLFVIDVILPVWHRSGRCSPVRLLGSELHYYRVPGFLDIG